MNSDSPNKTERDKKNLIVDIDRHVQETWNVFHDYAEPQFREHLYRKTTLPDGSERIAIGDRIMPFSVGLWDDPYTNEMYADGRFAPNDPKIKALDPQSYLAAMDQEGIDIAVVTPTLAMGNCSIPNGQIGSALSRAYGRWAHEFCSVSQDRLLPLYPITLYDVDQAVKDGMWAIKEMGFRGFQIVSLPIGTRNFHHPDFDPFWAMVQEMDVPVQFHSLSSLPDDQGRGPLVELSAGVSLFGGNLALHHLVSHRIQQHLTMASIVMGGVLERFPNLRVLFVEAGGGWVPSWLEEMDGRYDAPMMHRFVSYLKQKPSEYVQRQCIVGFTADEKIIGATAPLVGWNCIGWSSDFPHHDGVFPGAVAAVCEQIGNFAPEQQANFLGLNAARSFNMI